MKKTSKKPKTENLSLRKSDSHIRFNDFSLSQPFNTDMAVFQSGHKSVCPPGWLTKPAIYDHYILHFVLSGKGTYYAPSKTYSVRKGDLFLIKPFESIHYRADFKEPWTYYWVGFNGHDVWKYLKQCGFEEQSLVLSCGFENRLEDFFKNMAYPRMISAGQEYELLGNLYQLFAVLVDTHINQPLSKQEWYLTQAVSYIQQNYSDSSLKVSDIAGYVGIDRTYLYRLFQDAFQLSVQDFILDFRLQKAKSMLKFSDHPAYLIASSCGFENQSYFSSIFKKKFLRTPLEYRKNSRLPSPDSESERTPVSACSPANPSADSPGGCT